MGKVVTERQKLIYLTRSIFTCNRLKSISDMAAVAGSDASFDLFANLIRRSHQEKSRDRSNVTCHGCNEVGHISRYCPKSSTKNYKGRNYGKSLVGQMEKSSDHNVAKNCPPPFTNTSYRRAEIKNQTTNKNHHSTFSCALLSSSCANAKTLILDSGASHTKNTIAHEIIDLNKIQRHSIQ